MTGKRHAVVNVRVISGESHYVVVTPAQNGSLLYDEAEGWLVVEGRHRHS